MSTEDVYTATFLLIVDTEFRPSNCERRCKEARQQVVAWQQDEKPGELEVLDTLLTELHTLHKLLRIAT